MQFSCFPLATIQLHVTLICLSCLHLRNPRKYMDYYSFAEPRRDEGLSWPGRLTQQFTEKVVTFVISLL